jgi:hypothetical protein
MNPTDNAFQLGSSIRWEAAFKMLVSPLRHFKEAFL